MEGRRILDDLGLTAAAFAGTEGHSAGTAREEFPTGRALQVELLDRPSTPSRNKKSEWRVSEW
jgi:hypothetical protein